MNVYVARKVTLNLIKMIEDKEKKLALSIFASYN